MKLLNYIIKIALIIIALLFTIIISRIVPQNYFSPDILEMDSTWSKEPDNHEYVVDLNNDSCAETLFHQNINKSGSRLELRQKEGIQVFAKFAQSEFIVSRFFHFADINNDNQQELMFLSVIKDTVFLHIIGFDLKIKSTYLVDRVIIDTVKYSNSNLPDVENNVIVTNKTDIFFDLNAGYSVQPRNIYKYSVAAKKLTKTNRNSMVCSALKHINFEQHDYLLVQNTRATGNTLSPQFLAQFKNSKDKDELDFYERNINHPELIFEYSDIASYILLYDNNLHFAFEPIIFLGWTNNTKSDFVTINGVPNIVAFTNTVEGDSINKKITICDLQGKIGKEIRLLNNYTEVFADNKIVFMGNNTLCIFSEKLEPMKEIHDITFAGGFYDLERKNEKEFIAFNKNEMCIYSNDFQPLASFKIEQEFAPYPEGNGIKLLQIGKKHCFVYNTRLFYYMFSYRKNELAILKYPFYVAMFFVWLGILLLILRFNSMRLEKEKQKLEEIVAQRTHELQNKNIVLATQKEEIETQSEKIIEQYERLEKLDHFKESLTHTLVHDLKNPLSQITLNNDNPTVQLSVRKMMRLITNMLDVEKYETTQFKLNKENHSLHEMLQEIKKEHELSLQEKNLNLNLNFDNYTVNTDKDIIMRVFDNLLSNAIRFSPLNQNIDVFAQNVDENTIQIGIKNYGDTIPEEALPHIFDKYRHEEKSIKSTHRSTGLGLAFCKMAIEAHQQKISVRNESDGVVFSFTLSGEKPSQQIINKEEVIQEMLLTDAEKSILKPYFERLQKLEVYEISDILEILNEITQETENINALKQQIRNAAFACNVALYDHIIRFQNLEN